MRVWSLELPKTVVSTLKKLRQEDQQFKVIFSYIASLKPA